MDTKDFNEVSDFNKNELLENFKKSFKNYYDDYFLNKCLICKKDDSDLTGKNCYQTITEKKTCLSEQVKKRFKEDKKKSSYYHTIDNWLNDGNSLPSTEKLIKFSTIFDCSVDELLGLIEQKKDGSLIDPITPKKDDSIYDEFKGRYYLYEYDSRDQMDCFNLGALIIENENTYDSFSNNCIVFAKFGMKNFEAVDIFFENVARYKNCISELKSIEPYIYIGTINIYKPRTGIFMHVKNSHVMDEVLFALSDHSQFMPYIESLANLNNQFIGNISITTSLTAGSKGTRKPVSYGTLISKYRIDINPEETSSQLKKLLSKTTLIYEPEEFCMALELIGKTYQETTMQLLL